ncbi:MAG: 3-dehydroquinate synthase [Acutalibacteraceae bacterium]|nr:3-dehydroquinate synthase [Acutalibacteraceae bacterium]
MIIPVKTTTGGYNITLERGAHTFADKYFKLDRKVLIVTDDGVPAEYAKTVAASCRTPFIITLPQGEKTKSLDSYKYLLSEMVKNDFTRSDCVVAVGGGVVGDLAGFVAASYMRGVDFYNIPTTVLSQVDSSIGGKVAVDFDGYKNIVGAFYPPKAVIIDPDMLKTLPDRQISNGLAESVKMSLTSDKELFALFENGDIINNIDKIIEGSLKIKRFVVEQDEKEGGLRKILNFGHTLAHAIESENAMEKLYHGECVALGMIPMCSEEVRCRLIKVLEKLNLPTKTETDAEAIISAMKHDKKMSGDKITVIFVPEIGQYEMREMPFSDFEEQIRSAL